MKLVKGASLFIERVRAIRLIIPLKRLYKRRQSKKENLFYFNIYINFMLNNIASIIDRKVTSLKRCYQNFLVSIGDQATYVFLKRDYEKT